MKVRGSTPAGKPRAAATSAEVSATPLFAPSAIIVVVGVTTEAPFGALNVKPAAEAPDDASTVPASATATTS